MKKISILKTGSVLLACCLTVTALSGFSFTNNSTAKLSGMVTAVSYDDDDVIDTSRITSGSTLPDAETPTTTTTTTTTTSNSGGGIVGTVVPLYDIAAKSGSEFFLQCRAPAGADVSAILNGKSYKLSHNQENAKSSTYVNHFRKITIPDVTGTVDLGAVNYTVDYKDKEYSSNSSGNIFAVGLSTSLQVKIKTNSAMVFNANKNNASSGYRTIANKGSIDTVVEYSGDMYKLGTGGWINASVATPMTKTYHTKNSVTGTNFKASAQTETLILSGNAHPMYYVSHTKDSLVLTFYRTSGVGSIDISDSRIFSNADVTTKDGNTTITLTQSSAHKLNGYSVEYDGGKTKIVCKVKPTLSEGDQPLSGITIALDPGHGGSDTGTQGIATKNGNVEKDINLATAKVVKAYLESKGAEVLMTRTDDSRMELGTRCDTATAARVDFFISIHCNSAANKSATGTEVYFYHPNSMAFASNMEANFIKATGRKSRNARKSHFVVTLDSAAPSILLEMGFMTNADEYNSLNSQDGMDKAAVGIYNGIVATLQ